MMISGAIGIATLLSYRDCTRAAPAELHLRHPCRTVASRSQGCVPNAPRAAWVGIHSDTFGRIKIRPTRTYRVRRSEFIPTPLGRIKIRPTRTYRVCRSEFIPTHWVGLKSDLLSIQISIPQLRLARAHLHRAPRDPNLFRDARHFERITAPEHEVRDLTFRDLTAVVDPEHARRRVRHGGECRLFRQSMCNGIACELADLARIGALAELRERKRHAGAMQDRGVVEPRADRIEARRQVL